MSKIQSIKKKIELKKRLTEKEIELINNTHICSVYDFTYCIGHLTNFGKNEVVNMYRDEILSELNEYIEREGVNNG